MYKPNNVKTYIKATECIAIKDYLDEFLESFYPNTRVRIRHNGEAMVVKEQINMPQNTMFKTPNGFGGQSYWYEQKVDYVDSNLGSGKGVVFYFICNRCNRKAKYLYRLSYTDEPLCRVCSNLRYGQPNRKPRALSRLFNKPYLSSLDRYTIMKRANITKGDIENYLSDNCKE